MHRKKEYEELEQLSQEIEASAPKQEETPPKDEGAEETKITKKMTLAEGSERNHLTTKRRNRQEEKPDDKPKTDDKPNLKKNQNQNHLLSRK
jgi:hypothetical protein